MPAIAQNRLRRYALRPIPRPAPFISAALITVACRILRAGKVPKAPGQIAAVDLMDLLKLRGMPWALHCRQDHVQQFFIGKALINLFPAGKCGIEILPHFRVAAAAAAGLLGFLLQFSRPLAVAGQFLFRQDLFCLCNLRAPHGYLFTSSVRPASRSEKGGPSLAGMEPPSSITRPLFL